ncbi:fluoride efflux transporter CrcB [bacterium]|nr:fluoride efflux transporter CrcB [bacterium]
MRELLIAGLGGFIGSALRYWTSILSYRFLGQEFPYGTLIVNITGCFLIGLLMTIFEERFIVNPGLRIFLTIGILGGFTTFSTFSYETIALLREGSYFVGFENIIFSLAGCLAATTVGILIGRLI